MAESDVVRVAREYREQLARNEDAALRRMSRYWVKIEKKLQNDLEALAREVLDRQAKGQAVPRQFIYTLQRYRSMVEQVSRELPGYQSTVEDLIKEYQRKDYLLGLDAANAEIKATKPSSDVWTRVYKDAAETMAGFAGNGAPLYELLRHDYAETSESILDALVEGVARGKGYREVAKDMRDAMGMEYDRSLRIARTEINRSYRLANAEQYRRSGVVEKVLRLCYKPTACFACLMLDGEECPNGVCDDHPNGKCTTIVTTTGGITPEWQTGSEWFEEQSPEDQRRIMGAGRYELWKDHGVSLRSMVWMKPNPVWGGSPSVKTFDMMGIQSPLKGKNLQQEGSEPRIPERYQGDFSDFEPLDIDKKTRETFSELRTLAQQNQYEYGKIIGEKNSSKIFTSNKADGVQIDLDLVEGSNLRVYHSHTNVTPPSSADLRWLCNTRVSEIGSCAINGDTFIVRVGDGIRPDLSEFNKANDRIKNEITVDLRKAPDFFDWSEDERNYMFIREKFYRISREFGWQMEGGNLDEQ